MLLMVSCDPGYNVNHIVTNNTNDTLIIVYLKSSFSSPDTAKIQILAGTDSIIFKDLRLHEKPSDYGDCCVCEFDYITSSDTTTDISVSNNWTIESDYKRGSGYLNCHIIFD